MTWARSTHFLTSPTSYRMSLLQSTRFAELFIECLLNHREAKRFDLHAFVVMPDHVHVLFTLGEWITLERAAQFVKGTFSFRVKRDFGYTGEVWTSGYHDERMRSSRQCGEVIAYIEHNPVAKGLAATAQEFPFSSATGRWQMDDVPQWLKPVSVGEAAVSAV